MDGRELPGFYYDSAKRKYFKIGANNVDGSAAQYSVDSVKTRKRNSFADKSRTQHKARLRRQTIARSALSRCTSPSITLGYETGIFTKRKLVTSRDRLMLNNLGCTTEFRTSPIYSIGRYEQAISRFAKISDGLYLTVAVDSDEANHTLRFDDGKGIPYTPLAASRTGMSSLTVHSSGYWMTTNLRQESGANIEIGKVPSGMTLNPQSVRLGFGSPDITTWGAKPNPAPNATVSAIGTSESVLLFDVQVAGILNAANPNGSTSGASPIVCRRKCHMDILAVDWLSEHVVSCATRRGLNLWDTRTDGFVSRFAQAGGVQRIRCMGNQNELVCSGPNSVELFDVRVAHTSTSAPRSVRTSSSTPSSRSVLSLPTTTSLACGDLDVYIPGRILARPNMDHAQSWLEFYSLLDGCMLSQRAHTCATRRHRAVQFDADPATSGITLSYAMMTSIMCLGSETSTVSENERDEQYYGDESYAAQLKVSH